MSSTTTKTRPAASTPPPPMPPRPEGLESKIAYLTRVLKTPTIGRVWGELAQTAREVNWSHEEYLTAVLERQVADRESAGNTMRIRTAHFPQIKTLEDFNLDHLPSLRRDVLAHLATATFVPKDGSWSEAPRVPDVVRPRTGWSLGGESTGRAGEVRPADAGGPTQPPHASAATSCAAADAGWSRDARPARTAQERGSSIPAAAGPKVVRCPITPARSLRGP